MAQMKKIPEKKIENVRKRGKNKKVLKR